MGLEGADNKWFKSYLEHRHQFVTINGCNTDEVIMYIGVPEGSVLGPLLFLLYIIDLHEALYFCSTRHFADDTCLLS